MIIRANKNEQTLADFICDVFQIGCQLEDCCKAFIFHAKSQFIEYLLREASCYWLIDCKFLMKFLLDYLTASNE